jgi:hypothetical protein
MSNFLKQGNRKASKAKNKLAKKHGIEFYKLLAKIDELAVELVTHKEDVTEDNIQQLAVDYFGRELDDMEKMLVLSKIDDYKERAIGKD